MTRLRLLVCALALLMTACGSGGSVVDVGSAPSRPGTPVPAPVAPSSPAAPDRAPAPPAPSTPGASGADSGDEMPGDPVEPPFGTAGAEVGVVGVEAGDVLHVRARPGADQAIVDRLEPLARGIVLTGSTRRIGDAVWSEITVDGTTGWVNGRYVRLIAGTDDITAALVGRAGHLTAPTMRALAEQVVDAYGLANGYHITWGPRTDPALDAQQQRRIVISDGPGGSDPGEISLDVIDLFDDSIAAERLTVFAHADEGDGFSLKAVERTFFCWRGGTEVCV